MPADIANLLLRAFSGLPDPPAGPFTIRPVGGGSINETFQVSTKDNTSGMGLFENYPIPGRNANDGPSASERSSQGRWFCKFNDSVKYPGLFVTESRGLDLLARQNIVRIPLTIACTVLDERQVLILEWIPQGTPDTRFWRLFGEQLAALHHITGPQFGLDHDNYMGALPQTNTPNPSWPDFFIHQRLEPQVRLASDNGLLPHTARDQFQRLYRQLPALFPPEPPSLLHGDLWSGNFLCDDQNRPVLIDPAVYYGHRSIDLAMTTLFGGFDQPFYDAYTWHYPLPSNYRQQWTIANLYPLLIHLNLFGTSYLPNILHTIQTF